MKKRTASAQYINDQRRDYSIYVMQSRAIPAATDGLKSGGRRVLWMARDGKKVKSATLAGATMPIHPHASPEGAINTLAAPYGNNYPFFKGDGAFGTMMDATAYGASRYTAVSISAFAHAVLFADIDIIPMRENYDGTIMEPEHFLPLVPVAILNPSEGIAVGYATNVLPRSLEDIVTAQIMHLKGKKICLDLMPKFAPTESVSTHKEDTERGVAYYFTGKYINISTTSLKITNLPYGMTHKTIIKKLDDLLEQGVVVDYIDDSKKKIEISVVFKRGVLKGMDNTGIIKMLSLSNRHIENLNVLDFSGKAIWNTSPAEFISKFTDWRLGWYVVRYQRLKDLALVDMQRYVDINIAVTNNIGAVARKVETRGELKELLEALRIVNLDYIADLPIYRFTEEEKRKNELKMVESEKQLLFYESLLTDEGERRRMFISELETVLEKSAKGHFDR